jgi:hypothetical protein
MRTGIFTLLNEIIKDHTTYSFPVNSIQRDLTTLYFNQNNFDNICASITLKLKRKHGKLITHIFFLCLDRTFPNELSSIETLDPNLYFDKIEDFIELLGRIRITRIPKDSPDGLMMAEMN